MANTYKLIETKVIPSATSSLSFTSIPSTYTDLLLKVSARSDTGAAFAGLVIAPNGSSTNYTLKWMGDAGGGLVSYTQTTFGYNHLCYIPGGGAASSIFGNAEITIHNYASANFKSVVCDGANENNLAAIYQGISTGLWSSTTAISSLTFSTGGNFVTNTSFSLYGITKY